MPQPTPFEMYVKEFDLRLKLIETMGKWNKAMAEAEVNWANARLTRAKAATIERINRELHIAFQELKREERNVKDRLSKAKNDTVKTRVFVTARKPTKATYFAQAWAAFDWFLGEADLAAVRKTVSLPVTAKHRAKKNFVAMLVTRGELTDAPADITAFGPLKAWMQEHYIFFKAGPVHELMLEAMETIRASRVAVVERLEKRLITTRGQSYKKLEELRKFLGLPVAAQKTPSTPAGR